MKAFLFLASAFSLTITPISTAEGPANGPATTQSPGRAGTAHSHAAHSNRKRLSTQSNPNVSRPHLRTHHPPPALNGLGKFKNSHGRQMAAQLRTRARSNANGRNSHGVNNSIRQSYASALARYGHHKHDRNWWRQRYRTIVFARGCYYYLDTSYWYPAWGYDPAYDSYDYDGPIYTYGNLLPDQVIANVQSALQQAGYFSSPVTGSLGPETRASLAQYQRDQDLIVTGAIDEPTVAALGLN